ncbi:MAG: ATP-binding cassette domain-containing protein [Clostridia bacterium]|nr:ATP-binding cassette domain-containing protein [Clostridia bacterium]
MSKIVVENVSKKFNRQLVLDNINLKLTSGHIYGLAGINGSGKTVLMKCICGLSTPTSGRILIDDKQVGKDIDFSESIGALIESPGFIEHYSAYDNMQSLASIRKKTGKEEIKSLLEKVGLNPDEKKRVKKYSLGMRQKLGIAMALLDNPDIVILDEPFNALDKKSVLNVKDIILGLKSDNRLVILSSHDGKLLEEVTDKIYEIEEGKIIE